MVFAAETNQTGSLKIFNLETKKYSVFVEVEGYHVNCYWIDVDPKEKNEQWIFLTRSLALNQIRIIMDWKKTNVN